MPGPHFNQSLHRVRVTAQGFDESKEKKTPFFWLAFTPLFETDTTGAEIAQCADFEREVRLYLHENTIDQTVERLRGLGWDGASWADLEPYALDGFSFVDHEIDVRCSHEQQGDNVYERWELPSGGRRSEHKTGMTRRLDALFGSQLKATAAKGKKAAGKAKAKPKSEPELSTATEDEIPF